MKKILTTVIDCNKLWLKTATGILLLAFLFSTKTFAQYGVAPIVNPAGGFNIDGRVVASSGLGPGGIVYGPNDWLPTLFTTLSPTNYPNATTSINPPFNGPLFSGKIFHKIDYYDDQTNDDIFDGGNKLNDNPNSWGWRSQKPPAKDDINNSMLFVTQSGDGHYWVIISGDRLSTDGTSYLDVEFYQGSISKHGATCSDPAVLGGTGTFCADGPNGGRTLGDLSVTLSYTGGGNFAAVSFLKWVNTGTDQNPVYDYVDTTVSNNAYVAANNTSVTPTSVPYGAFGNITYDSLQYIEAAIDLTALIDGAATGPCAPIPFHTCFIKTKSSAASNADLKDFIEPFVVNFCTDITPPTVTPTSTSSTVLGCSPSTATINAALGGATATDNCASGLSPTASDGAVGSSGCSRSQTRTWSVADACGNLGTASRTVTWTVDATPPVVTASSTASTSLGCNPSTAIIDGTLGGATASDNCAGVLTPTASDGAVGSTGCSRSLTRTWIATDACGNTGTLSRTVTWTSDNAAPIVTPTSTANTALGCNPSTATIDATLGGATASDNCAGVLTPTASDGAVGSAGCSRSLTRTWSVTDNCGNTGTSSRTVTWTFDITPPTITATSTANIALGCNPSTANVNGTLGGATATDNCGSASLTFADGAVGSTGCARSTTRTWTATDGCNNTATLSRTVTWTFDMTAPVVTPTSTASTTLGCNPSTSTINIALGNATASDNCDGALTATSSDGAVGSSGCTRTQTRTFTATDNCGNTGSASRTVTWTFDNTNPVVTPTSTGSTSLGCNPSTAIIDGALGGATASDNCSGALTPTASDGAIGSSGCTRTQTRTWIATDNCGNTGTASRTVTWTFDNTSPVVTPSSTVSTTLGCNPSSTIINSTLGGATASDNCAGVLTPSASDGAVGSSGCARSQTRTWTATDNCGNTGTASRTVTWTFDNTNPVVTPTSTASATLGCNPTTATIDAALGGATATDNCSTSLTPIASDGSVGSSGCARTQTRTWSVTDNCGNTGTASRTVTWTFDITGPVVTPTSNTSTTLGCNPSTATINNALGGASVSDNCGGSYTPTASDGAIGSTGCARTQTRTWTATDNCGNTGSASRTVSWTFDITTPTVTTTSTASTSLGCNPSSADINNALGGATATDNCSGVLTPNVSDGSVGSTGCTRAQTRKWTATDGCGNTATTSRTVTWTFDMTKPVITPTATSSTALGCNVTMDWVMWCLGGATASDNCSGSLTPTASDGAVGSTGCSRSLTRTWSATDACGNVGTASRTLTWTVDTDPPVISAAGSDFTQECSLPLSFTPPTATDNCGSIKINLIEELSSPEGYACTKTITRTWDASDGCGNHSETRSQTITQVDTQGPVFNCPKDRIVNASKENVQMNCQDLGGGGVATVFGSPDVNGSPLNDNKVDFRQPRNEGHPAVPLNWTNGITNNTQAEYFEGMGVPQRIIFTNLSPGTHTFVFRTEAVKHQSGDRHAYDFLMSWEQAVATAANIGNGSLNELQNLIAQTCNEGITSQAGSVCGSFTTSAFATLTDNMGNPPNHHGIRNVNDAIACFEGKYGNRQIEMKANSTIVNFNIVFNGYSGDATGDNYAWYTITWSSQSKDVMFKIAAHAAAGESSCGYGACYGAADINGGPYHFKLESLDNHSLGNRDNQMQLEPTCKTDIPVEFDTPHIHDCDPNPTLEVTTADSIVVNPDGSTSHYRKWRATDHCGNTSSCMQTITVICDNYFTEILGPTTVTGQVTTVPTTAGKSTEPPLRVSAYPNPYNDNVRFVVTSPISGQATLEVYDMLGQKIQTVYQGFIAVDRTMEIYYPVPVANRKNLIYILRVGDKQATGKLIRID